MKRNGRSLTAQEMLDTFLTHLRGLEKKVDDYHRVVLQALYQRVALEAKVEDHEARIARLEADTSGTHRPTGTT